MEKILIATDQQKIPNFLIQFPRKIDKLTPEEILICETQGRMALQVAPEHAEHVLTAIQSKGKKAAIIGEITDDDKEVFEYNGKTVAVVQNKPVKDVLEEMKKEC